jgi:hypothetical protein
MNDKIEDIGSYENVKKTIENDNHEFIILPNAQNIGIIDFNKSLENLSIIIQKGKSALEQEFLLPNNKKKPLMD